MVIGIVGGMNLIEVVGFVVKMVRLIVFFMRVNW